MNKYPDVTGDQSEQTMVTDSSLNTAGMQDEEKGQKGWVPESQMPVLPEGGLMGWACVLGATFVRELTSDTFQPLSEQEVFRHVPFLPFTEHASNYSPSARLWLSHHSSLPPSPARND